MSTIQAPASPSSPLVAPPAPVAPSMADALRPILTIPRWVNKPEGASYWTRNGGADKVGALLVGASDAGLEVSRTARDADTASATPEAHRCPVVDGRASVTLPPSMLGVAPALALPILVGALRGAGFTITTRAEAEEEAARASLANIEKTRADRRVALVSLLAHAGGKDPAKAGVRAGVRPQVSALLSLYRDALGAALAVDASVGVALDKAAKACADTDRAWIDPIRAGVAEHNARALALASAPPAPAPVQPEPSDDDDAPSADDDDAPSA